MHPFSAPGRRHWLTATAAVGLQVAVGAARGATAAFGQDGAAGAVDAPPATALPGLPAPSVGPLLPARRRVVATDGVGLQLTEARPAGASPGADPPTILLVPGWGMPGAIWQPQFAELGDRFRMVALDPRGQGDSDVPIAASAYSVDRRADDLHDVLGTLPPVVLVGWSLGVLEALHYLHRHGDARVRALMLVDNSVGEPPAPQPSDFLARLRTDRAGTVERFVRGMFATAQPETRIALLVRSVLQAPLDASVALLSYPLPREHWRRIVRAVRRPLVYAVTPRFAAQARSLQDNRPGTQVEVFEQAGHALFVDAAPRFNAILARFAGTAI